MTTMTKTNQKTAAGSSPKLTAMGFTNQMPSTHQKKKKVAKINGRYPRIKWEA